VAASIKDSAGIDDHAGRVDFSGDYALGLNLDSTFCENYAVEAPGDDHTVAFDLAFDFGGIAEDYGLLRDDISFDVAVDAERSRNLERAFQRYALIDKSSPLFARAAALRRT